MLYKWVGSISSNDNSERLAVLMEKSIGYTTSLVTMDGDGNVEDHGEIRNSENKAANVAAALWPGLWGLRLRPEPQGQAGWVAIGIYSDPNIYGLGATAALAMEDAAHGERDGYYKPVRASEALCYQVATLGGCRINWKIRDGVAQLEEE